MADVRALLAAERQARRIQHPHLTYTPSGGLLCNVCDLNVKAEQLWSGHLKSLNHRKNVQKSSEQAPSSKTAKRKREREEDVLDEQTRGFEVDSRKKPKSAAKSNPTQPSALEEALADPLHSGFINSRESTDSMAASQPAKISVSALASLPLLQTLDNEEFLDEMTAFERDIAPLAHSEYASATITAAPVSAAELQEHRKQNLVQQREDESEAQKEEEGNRMMEEFEIMEEMEDKINKLRARREALRGSGTIDPNRTLQTVVGTQPGHSLATTATNQQVQEPSDEEEDDWYR